jgi:hypothetical protein
MKKHRYFKFGVVLAGCMLLGAQSCTDLESEIFSQADSKNFPSNERELLSTIGGTYGELRNFIWAPWELIQSTTDEVVVPTRGPDWYDNGSWQQLAKHTWNPVSPGQINGAWNWGFTVIASANINIQALKESSLQVEGKETIVAELRMVRAFAYYWLCDMFGRVPILTEDTPAGNPPQNSRQEVFNFVESEIKAALPDLRNENTGVTYGRFNQAAANALLAKLYLNAEVFTGTARWQDAVAACDAVINSGQYSLNADFLANFAVNNDKNGSSKENIFVIPYDKTYADGQQQHWRTLHYALGGVYGMPGNPWNGWATRAEFYNTFTEDDKRKAMWLVGPQRNASGEIIRFKDAVDNVEKDLIFTPEITSLEKAFGNEGVRGLKYEVQRNNNRNGQDNDQAIFRYADVLLMKAEALVRLGNAGAALPLVNEVRERAGVPAFTEVTLDNLYMERGRELAWEGWRRNDMIRFGKYDDPYQFKTDTDPNKNLFPIPSQQISTNPNLTQNPGY